MEVLHTSRRLALTFERTGTEQLYFNPRLGAGLAPNPTLGATNPWAKNDPVVPAIGTDYYWMRIRYPDGTAVTQLPVFEQFRLHTNRTELQEDGWIQLYGTARTIRRLKWDIGLVESVAPSPGNQDIFLSSTIGIGIKENQFTNGGADRIGSFFPVPLDMDTSGPIGLAWAWSPTTNEVANDVQWIVRWAYSRPSDSDLNQLLFASGANPNVIGYRARALQLPLR